MVDTQVTDDEPDISEENESSEEAGKSLSDDSKPQKVMGRPKKDPGTLPSPSRSDLSPVQFFTYWRTLTPAQQNNATVYVYRMNPVVDVKHKRFTLAKAHGQEVAEDENATTNIGKLTVPFGQGIKDKLTDADVLREVLQLFGCGDYTFGLNDSGRKSNKKQVCRTFVSTPHDYTKHPPILDINTLVMDDYKNEPYIKFLRARGEKLPGDAEVKEEEDEDLANNEAVKVLSEALVEQTKRTQAQPAAITPTVVAPPPAMDSNILKGILEANADGTKVLFKLFSDVHNSNAKSQDPLEMIRQVGTVLNEFRQGPATDPTVMVMLTAMQTKLDNQERLEIERIRQENVDLKAGRGEVLPPTPPKSLLDTVDEALLLVERFKGIAGGSTTEEEPLKRAAGGILGSLMGSEMPWWGPILGNVAGMAVQAFIARGMPMPQAPGMPMGGMNGMPQQPMPAQPGQPVMAPPVPIPGPQQIQNPQMPPQQEDPMIKAMQMLNAIAPVLLTHLENNDRTGVDFAQHIIDGYTRKAYDQIRQVGPETIMQAFGFHPQLAEQVKLNPQRVGQFVDDFFNYDAIRAAQEEVDTEPIVEEPAARKIVRRPAAPVIPE